MSVQRYYYANIAGQPIGPLDASEIHGLLCSELIAASTPVIPEGETVWSTAGELFFSHPAAPIVKPSWRSNKRRILIRAAAALLVLVIVWLGVVNMINRGVFSYSKPVKQDVGYTRLQMIALVRKANDLCFKQRFEEAVETYDSALKVSYTLPDGGLTERSEIFDFIAMNYEHWAEASTPEECLSRRTKAVRNYQSALDFVSFRKSPIYHAGLQTRLANALRQQGRCHPKASEERIELLKKSVAVYRLAFQVYTRADNPMDWADTHTALARTLVDLGEAQVGIESGLTLKEAIKEFRTALEYFTKEEHPDDWASTHHDLGHTLGTLSYSPDYASKALAPEHLQLLNDACDSYAKAYEIFTREDNPHRWATDQFLISLLLIERAKLARGEEKAQLLDKALSMLRAAQKVFHPIFIQMEEETQAQIRIVTNMQSTP